MNRIKYALILSLWLSGSWLIAQPKSHHFEELDSLLAVEPRPVVVFLHTDWCKYCQMMKQVTFNDPEVTQQLDQKCYFVSFDAESRENVDFQGNTFKYRPNGKGTGIHELALGLGQKSGKISYPTLVFLNEKLEIMYRHDQYIKAKELKKVLRKL